MTRQKFKTTIQPWNDNIQFRQGEKCNAISFINKSIDNQPIINGYQLYYGECLSIQGNENEVDETLYNISIDKTVGTPNLWIITKDFLI